MSCKTDLLMPYPFNFEIDDSRVRQSKKLETDDHVYKSKLIPKVWNDEGGTVVGIICYLLRHHCLGNESSVPFKTQLLPC